MKKKHENIPFEMEKAIGIMETRKIKSDTILTWKRQGFMPGRYFTDNKIFQINGKNLITLRLEKGLNQSEFINAFNQKLGIDVTQVSVSNWETGTSSPSKMYRKFLEIFHS